MTPIVVTARFAKVFIPISFLSVDRIRLRAVGDEGLRQAPHRISATGVPGLSRRAAARALPWRGFQDRETDMDMDEQRSFGVFKPVGHVVVSLPDADAAERAAKALRDDGREVVSLSDREMLESIDRDVEQAGLLASVGQELNLAKARRELAARGYHWLLVKVADDDEARHVADLAKPHGAERAEHYGRFVIEDLIQHSTDTGQVFESPARGHDAQTPSGTEAERTEIRPPRS
jgi:hypothetical protein